MGKETLAIHSILCYNYRVRVYSALITKIRIDNYHDLLIMYIANVRT